MAKFNVTVTDKHVIELEIEAATMDLAEAKAHEIVDNRAFHLAKREDNTRTVALQEIA